MKNKLLSTALICMAFPVCSHATTVAGDDLNIGSSNTVPSGSESGAIGHNNTVDYSSLAVGGNIVAHDYSFVGGESSAMSINNGYMMFLYGDMNKSGNGYSSAVFGGGNYFDGGVYGFVAGMDNDTSGGSWASILLGRENNVDGAASGADTTIDSSVLIGANNYTKKSGSWVIGKGNIGQNSTVTLGTYASEVANASLIVGRGADENNRSNGLVVLKDGSVQIPSGNLILGSEPALTATSVNTHLTTNGYLKKATGQFSSASADALFALGDGANAGGLGSIAMGPGSSTVADASVAIGTAAEASEVAAVAIGTTTYASGISSLALGTGATASGEGSTAISFSIASGDRAFAGAGSNATGAASVALGYGQATGKSSVAIGNYYFSSGGVSMNMANGDNSVVIGGIRNRADGLGSFASGTFSKATSAHSVVLGSLNKGSSTSSTTWVQTDPLFELGNGYTSDIASDPAPSLRSNAITTLKNGQTTLSNKFWVSTTPKDVPSNAAESSNGEALVVEGHTVLKGNTKLSGKVTLEEPQGDISMGIYQ